MTSPDVEKRRGSDRRTTFTQSPFVAEFLEDLSKETGISKADLINIFVQVGAVAVSRYRKNLEWVTFDKETNISREEPAVRVLLGDVMSSLGLKQTGAPETVQ